VRVVRIVIGMHRLDGEPACPAVRGRHCVWASTSFPAKFSDPGFCEKPICLRNEAQVLGDAPLQLDHPRPKLAASSWSLRRESGEADSAVAIASAIALTHAIWRVPAPEFGVAGTDTRERRWMQSEAKGGKEGTAKQPPFRNQGPQHVCPPRDLPSGVPSRVGLETPLRRLARCSREAS
jgi:hypothetical protein